MPLIDEAAGAAGAVQRPAEPVETLDATVPIDAEPPGIESPKEVYDPEKTRDLARANITYWLLALFTLLVVFAFGSLYAIEGRPTFEHLKSLVELLLGPLVALVSAATGFYFGAHSANRPK